MHANVVIRLSSFACRVNLQGSRYKHRAATATATDWVSVNQLTCRQSRES